MPTQEQLNNLAKLIGEVKDRFPQLAPFLERPDIGNLIYQAASAGWSSGELQAAVEKTDYWKNTTESQRNWDALSATDPASAQRQFFLQAQNVQNMRTRLGVNIDEGTYQRIAVEATRNGWDNSVIKTALLGAHAQGGWQNLAGGDIARTITQVRNTASNFGVSLSDPTTFKFAQQLLDESMDAGGVEEYIRSQAMSRYARNDALVAALKSGMTTKAYADPYLQVAAKELSVNPESINLEDPKWSKFLEDSPDPAKQGMTLDQWRQTIRRDSVYGWDQTTNARDEAAAMAAQFTKKFGVLS